MTMDELIAKARNIGLTDADITEMENRIADAEAAFALEAEAKRITPEWLNREYTI